MVNLANKTFAIFGLRGSGKSVMAHHLGTLYGKKALLYDTLNEFPEASKYHKYIPEIRGDTTELSVIAKAVMANRKYKMFIIDEANRYAPSKPHPLPQAIADLNDWHRHFDLSVGYIARRPVQLNQDLTELAEFLIIFNLKGRADLRFLEDINSGLGDTVVALKPFHFVIVDKNRQYEIYKPIPFDKNLLKTPKLTAYTG